MSGPFAIVPDCTVRFDPVSGCGVNVARSEVGGFVRVSIAFVTRRGTVEPNDLTVAQAEQLRAALDAVLRVEPLDYDPSTGEPLDPEYLIADVASSKDRAA